MAPCWGIPPSPIPLTFFGAKKEAKKHPPPPRPPPIWGGCNLLRPETGLRKGFGIARKACALKGERYFTHKLAAISVVAAGYAGDMPEELCNELLDDTDLDMVQSEEG